MKKLPNKIKIHNDGSHWPTFLVDKKQKKDDISAVAWCWDKKIAEEIVKRWNSK